MRLQSCMASVISHLLGWAELAQIVTIHASLCFQCGWSVLWVHVSVIAAFGAICWQMRACISCCWPMSCTAVHAVCGVVCTQSTLPDSCAQFLIMLPAVAQATTLFA